MSATTPVPPPPSRGNGCLIGCMAILLILCLPAIVAGWFFWNGYRHDPALRAATELVRRDGIARQVLGDNIHVTGVEASGFAYELGLRSEHDDIVDLEGSRGRGKLDVRAHAGRGGVKFDSLWLTGPDGRRYDLLHHAPSPGDIENSI